jgi:GTP-binding protein EngB required for normal cell division
MPQTSMDRAEAVRLQTLAVLSSLTETAPALGLADPASSLEQYGKKLADNTYQVLVVGEAKRGKSTFVNALIGRDILPTDVDIATSQVFRICPAEREAYCLRFEDDSQQEIAAAELASYGSQVVADADGVPRLDQMIRWIEVDVPARFLPANVRILDTPGLGALYAAHAQITHRFVPHADAVVFVLDSQAPIGEPEIQIVTALLEVTRSIFFIQTKIDLFRREVWQEIQKRNEEILKKQFGDRLSDPRVWPISSINLRKHAQTGDDDYLMVSRHNELAAALQAFLFRVAGWSRSAEAITLAGHYQALSRQTLAARLGALTEESKQKRAEFQQQAMERRKQFEADWGERGQKRRELLENIHTFADLGKRMIRNALSPGGDLERHFRSRINHLTGAATSFGLLRSGLPEGLRGTSGGDTITECGQWLRTLPQEVEAYALTFWEDVRKTTETKCTEVLAPFALAAEGVMHTPAAEPIAPNPGEAPGPHGQQGAPENLFLTTARFGSLLIGTAGAANFLTPVLATVVGLTAAPLFLGTLAIAAAGITTVLADKRAQLRAGKTELLQSLGEILQRLRNHLLSDVDLKGGRFTRVDECFNSLERCLGETIAKLAAQKLAEAQSESDRLGEEARLDDQQRAVKAEETRRQLADWDGIGCRLQEIRIVLEELERGQGAEIGGRASGQEATVKVK